MKFKLITEKEAYARLSKPFNPPIIQGEFTEKAFYAEWHSTRHKLEVMLRSFGSPDAYGQGDYYVGDNASLSRGIGVCITSAKPLVPTLITKTQNLLQTFEYDYEVNYTISTRDGDFAVFVNRGNVLGWCPDLVQKQLGMNGT